MSEPNAGRLPIPGSSTAANTPLQAAPDPLPVVVKPSRRLDDEDLLIDPAMQPEEQSLRTQQRQAIDAIAQGMTIAEAAEYAGIGRTTLYRWMKADPAFMTAMQAWRARTRRGVADRLLRVADKASSNVQSSVDCGNIQTSVAVLRGLGFLSGRRPAPKPKPDASPSASSGGVAPDVSKKLIMELRQLLLSVELPREKSNPDSRDAVAAPEKQPKLIEQQQ